MKTSEYFILCYLIMIRLFEDTHGLPDEYCYPKPNLDDCGGKPTPLFSYYKLGSRCEIEIWRGCPTMNIFKNEFSCSHHCIGRLKNNRGDNDDWGNFNASENEVVIQPETNDCEGKLNEEDCKKEPVEVYTFDSNTKTCVKAIWKGCETTNKFDDYQLCNKTCDVPIIDFDFEEKLYNISLEDVQAIDKLLDEFLENNDTEEHDINTLKRKVKPEVPAEDNTIPVTDDDGITHLEVTDAVVTEAAVTEEAVTEAPATEAPAEESHEDEGEAEEIVTT